ncbi:archaetidylserine decarboxylase [Pontibacter sp. G13]|uniref:archaetidylserine decarboxylase n=1 Tax=Pontibacter sp. G13 TaxID=3074898 RepID=UPI00288A0D7D|nr:archaetidylserine decarboxylase [Pontibacter sp. G13]WNJ20308.1 archaetidylserine decarboxylase [Pontibacter sp. G13]
MQITYIDRHTGEIKHENPPAEGLLNALYHNPFGKMALLPLVKRKFISEFYGRSMKSPSSVNRIEEFVQKMGIDMSESLKPIDAFGSFNEFFHRELKPEARPIGSNLVSPGDGRLLAFESVKEIHNFFVKGREFTLPEFLDNEELAAKHQDDVLIILRLAPNDYHRFHFPYAGTPGPIQRIKGSYYSVSPYALAGNFTKVFCENKREYCLLDTPDKGEIVIAPVGATMVGSIIETYQPNRPVRKGDEMGYFEFGGSTIVMLVDRNKVSIDEDILANTRNKMETFVKMGETIGA